MSYIMRRFQVTTGSGGGGTYFADQINQFLLLNPAITPVSLTISWRYGRSRSDQFYLNLVYRGGSVPVRSWCIQFQSTATLTAEAQATTFFANNPTYAPICTQVVSRPGVVTTSRRLLVIYATLDYLQPQCVRQAVAAAPQTGLAVGSIGAMYDTLDLARPAIPVMNLGNVTWPAGGANLAVTRIGNSPDLCAFGGIAPGCYAGGGISPPAPLLPTLLCGHCFPPEIITISTTSTSSTSTTTNTGTTTTSTSTTSTSTSTTTNTGTTTTSTTTTSTTTSTTSTTSTTLSTTTTAGTPCSICGITQPSCVLLSYQSCDPNSPVVSGTGVFQIFLGGGGACGWYWAVSTSGSGTVYVIVIYTASSGTYRLFVGNSSASPDFSGPALACCPNGFITGSVSYPNPDCPDRVSTIMVQFNGGGSC